MPGFRSLQVAVLLLVLAGQHEADAFVAAPLHGPRRLVRLSRAFEGQGLFSTRGRQGTHRARLPGTAMTAGKPESTETPAANAGAPPSRKTAIIGGGPTGLTTAIMLAQKGWTDIHVYDRLPEPPSPDDEAAWSDTARFYLIGLGGRGQKVSSSRAPISVRARNMNALASGFPWAIQR